MGRRLKLTDDLIARLCKAVRLGATKELACKAAGLGERTLYEYLERAAAAEAKPEDQRDDTDALYLRLADSLDTAEGEAAEVWLQAIDDAAKGIERVVDGKVVQILPPDWRAAAWKLERRFPMLYGQRTAFPAAPGELTWLEMLRELVKESPADPPPAGT